MIASELHGIQHANCKGNLQIHRVQIHWSSTSRWPGPQTWWTRAGLEERHRKARSSWPGSVEDASPMERCTNAAKIRDSRYYAIEWRRREYKNVFRAKKDSPYTELPLVQASTDGLVGHGNQSSNALPGCTDRQEKRSAATNEWGGGRIQRYQCDAGELPVVS